MVELIFWRQSNLTSTARSPCCLRLSESNRQPQYGSAPATFPPEVNCFIGWLGAFRGGAGDHTGPTNSEASGGGKIVGHLRGWNTTGVGQGFPHQKEIETGHSEKWSSRRAFLKNPFRALPPDGCFQTEKPEYFENRNLLKLRSPGFSCPFCLSDNGIWGQ